MSQTYTKGKTKRWFGSKCNSYNGLQGVKVKVSAFSKVLNWHSKSNVIKVCKDYTHKNYLENRTL